MASRPKPKAAPAAPVAGETIVIALPGFREIPKSLFPLKTAEAQSEYDTLARILFERGRLTIGAHRALSSYAAQFDSITVANTTPGKQTRASWFAQLDKARRELGLDDLDKPIASPAGAAPNKFAGVGFAGRRRPAV